MNDSAYAVSEAVTIFTGFRQTRVNSNAGLVRIEAEAHWTARRDHRLLFKPNTSHIRRASWRVNLLPWWTDLPDLATYYARSALTGVPQRHVVIGFSYGGQTAVNFCRELMRRGTPTIEHLLLADPVRRWPCLPGVAAALGAGTIKVPRSVRRLTVSRRRGGRWGLTWPFLEPAGHPVRFEGNNPPDAEWRPLLSEWRPLLAHESCDEDQAFRGECRRAVERLFGVLNDEKPRSV